MSRKKKDAAGGREPGEARWIPFALFFLAFVLRLLFWQATPDHFWAYSAAYQGDALIWLDYASALQHGLPFAQNLPLRPPGNAYLIALLWDGSNAGLSWLKLCWCGFGALTVSFFYRATRAAFSYPVALFAGLATAAASPLLIFSTSLNNETPYLLLVSILFANWRGTCHSPSPARLAWWGLVNALACLFRAEHLLFFAIATAAALWLSRRHDRLGSTLPVLAKRLALIGGAAFLCLLPWHFKAWSACRDFNRLEPVAPPPTEQMLAAVERELAFLVWQDDARAAAAALPAFTRRTAANFVAATVAYRGGREVRAADFAILEAAFGSRPEPIPEYPLIALYGGLNFFLANPGDGSGGFSRVALEAKPPLEGGAASYPPMMTQGLPPNDLAFTYPPHLAAVNHGYRLGLDWIVKHPGELPGLLLNKAAIFWSGAAPGLGGFNAPLGLSGTRRRVDLAVADGAVAQAWRLLLFGLCACGLWVSRRRAEVWPFLALLFTQVVAGLAFFGYARLGGLALPAVAALVAAGVAALPWPAAIATPSPRRLLRAAIAIAALLLIAEIIRTIHGEVPYLDGQNTAQGDPFNPDLHENRRFELR